MKEIKVSNYSDLNDLQELKDKVFIIDLSHCVANHKKRVIDFFCGLTFLHGSMKKINYNKYEIRIND